MIAPQSGRSKQAPEYAFPIQFDHPIGSAYGEHDYISGGDMNERKCAVVLLGPPGSGKTTVGRSLSTRNSVSVIEAGSLLRNEVRLATPLSQQIKQYMDAGELVPLDLVKQVVCNELEKTDSDLVLFDGFPRSLPQIDLLLELLKDLRLHLCGIVILKVDLQTTLNRLGGRRICLNCGTLFNVHTHPPREEAVCDKCGGKLIQRPDDQPEVIRERFKTYEFDTAPVIALFKREFGNVTWEISANLTPAQVADHVWQKLQKNRPSTNARNK